MAKVHRLVGKMKVTKHLTSVYPNDIQEPDKKAFVHRVTSLLQREGDKCLKGNPRLEEVFLYRVCLVHGGDSMMSLDDKELKEVLKQFKCLIDNGGILVTQITECNPNN